MGQHSSSNKEEEKNWGKLLLFTSNESNSNLQEPAKKTLNKAEKGARAAWETGNKELLVWRASKVEEGKKKPPFTQTISDKICFAIQSCFPDSPSAQAYIPLEEQSQNSYQQSTRGRKANLSDKSKVSHLENSNNATTYQLYIGGYCSSSIGIAPT